jgi:hypothetical protein
MGLFRPVAGQLYFTLTVWFLPYREHRAFLNKHRFVTAASSQDSKKLVIYYGEECVVNNLSQVVHTVTVGF